MYLATLFFDGQEFVQLRLDKEQLVTVLDQYMAFPRLVRTVKIGEPIPIYVIDIEAVSRIHIAQEFSQGQNGQESESA